MDDPTTTMLNQAVLSRLTSDDPGMVKEAVTAINEYTRVKLREDGFLRRVLPPLTITEFDRQVDTDKPVKVVDKEPDSPAAISVPFGSSPMNRYIRGPRYRVMFDRILTPKFTKDVIELMTWHMDIRQILSDNAIKDLMAEEDSKFLTAVRALLVGAGSVLPETGVAQWVTISGGVTRDTLAAAMQVLPKTYQRLVAATVLVNQITIWEFVKWGRDEVGGDDAQAMLRQGFQEREFMGVRFIVTIKWDLVPTNTIFLFAEPKFLGKLFMIEDVTMYVNKRAFMLEFFAYECLGACIGNVAGVGRVDFTA